MKILYHHRTVSKDGMDVHITEMIQAFKSLGHEVVLVAPTIGSKHFGDGSRLVESIRARLPRFASELLELCYNLASYRYLAETIRKEKPDAIYERYALFLVAGIWVKHRYKLPLLLEINSPLFVERKDHGGLSLQSIASYCENWVWRNANVCLPVTNVLAEQIRKSGIPSQQICVIPNGVNLETFSPFRDGKAIRDRYKLGQKIVLGFTGFVRPWHGLDTILHAIADIGTAEDVHLMIVGDGPARQSLEQLALQLGIAGRLTFTGIVQRSDMPAHIAAFDIALQPDATPYASPLKLLEYMALGKSILAPDQSNIRELLEDGRTALLFNKEDTGAMRTKLLQLISDRTLRQRLGQAAASEVLERPLTWQSNAERVLAILQSIVAGKSAQRPEPQSGNKPE